MTLEWALKQKIAIEIGIISGSSATGANQIIKQMFLKNKEE